jgi:hypothetical protein
VGTEVVGSATVVPLVTLNIGTLVGIVDEKSVFLVVGGGRVVTSRFEKKLIKCTKPLF